MRRGAALLLAGFCTGAQAQLEPGEWEFTSTSTSRLFARPQIASFKRCIRKDEAENPDRWMSSAGDQTDCTLTPGARTADTFAWKMECPKANLRGTGSARMAGSTLTGETFMTGEVQGQKFDLRTKVTGRRVGPCAS